MVLSCWLYSPREHEGLLKSSEPSGCGGRTPPLHLSPVELSLGLAKREEITGKEKLTHCYLFPSHA